MSKRLRRAETDPRQFKRRKPNTYNDERIGFQQGLQTTQITLPQQESNTNETDTNNIEDDTSVSDDGNYSMSDLQHTTELEYLKEDIGVIDINDFNNKPVPEYIDDRTKLIVSGFIRRIEKRIPTPIDILFLSLQYIDDHFLMHRGTYEWKISNPQTIKHMLVAPVDQEWCSDHFEIAKLKWIIEIIPNKHGNFNGFVRNLYMPSEWTSVITNFTMECKELDLKATHTSAYHINDSFGWTADILSLADVININPKQLTFTITLRLIRVYVGAVIKYAFKVINYRKQYQLNWKINTKNGPKTSRIYSDIVGDMFCACYDTVDSEVVLKICGLPTKEQTHGVTVCGLQVRWGVRVGEADFSCSQVAKLLSNGDWNKDCSDLALALSFDELKEYECLTFVVDIEILNEYDVNGKVIKKECQIENEWDAYMNNEYTDC